MIKYTIQLDPRTKKNHMQLISWGPVCKLCGRKRYSGLAQGRAYREYAEAARWFLRPVPKAPLGKKLEVKCLFYLKTRRKVDLLNLLAAVDDLLVESHIIADDNSDVVYSHDGSRVFRDKDRPRTEIYIREMQEDGDAG